MDLRASAAVCFLNEGSSVTRSRTPEHTPAAAQPGDPNRILTSIGLVPYDWRIDTDAIAWGANAGEVLQVREADAIATGRGYAGLLDPENTTSRYDAVTQTGGRDFGHGVPYQAED